MLRFWLLLDNVFLIYLVTGTIFLLSTIFFIFFRAADNPTIFMGNRFSFAIQESFYTIACFHQIFLYFTPSLVL